MTKAVVAPMKSKFGGASDEERREPLFADLFRKYYFFLLTEVLVEDIAKPKQPLGRKLSETKWLPILLVSLGYFVWLTVDCFHGRYPQSQGGVQLPGKHRNDEYPFGPCSEKIGSSPDRRPVPGRSDLTLAEQETIITESISNTTIAQWSYYYTHGKHLAGTNKSMAEWTRDKWIEYGIPSHLVEYEVYLNYPVSHSLSLTINGEEEFVAGLEEDVLPEDPTTGAEDRVPTFHGYSKSGRVRAEYIYVGWVLLLFHIMLSKTPK